MASKFLQISFNKKFYKSQPTITLFDQWMTDVYWMETVNLMITIMNYRFKRLANDKIRLDVTVWHSKSWVLYTKFVFDNFIPQRSLCALYTNTFFLFSCNDKFLFFFFTSEENYCKIVRIAVWICLKWKYQKYLHNTSRVIIFKVVS